MLPQAFAAFLTSDVPSKPWRKQTNKQTNTSLFYGKIPAAVAARIFNSVKLWQPQLPVF